MAGGSSSAAAGNGNTGAGTRKDVTLKLPQLQDCCKRDPIGYRDDYNAQVRRLEHELKLLSQTTGTATSAGSRVVELIQFAAAVSSTSYKGEETKRISNLYMDLLRSSSVAIPKDVRQACVSALILMRNKNCMNPLELLELFFGIMTDASNSDKSLRELLYRHMVNDIRNINKKGKRDDKLNRTMQCFLHRIVVNSTSDGGDSNEMAKKRAVDIVCELYRRHVWTDERTVAIVASAVECSTLNVSCRAMRFFLNIEEKMELDKQQQQDFALNNKNSVIDYHLHSKKTNRRQRQTVRALKNKKAQQKRENSNNGEDWMEVTVDPSNDKDCSSVEASKKLYPAIELLRDPQGLAEMVLKRLRNGGGGGSNIKYEHKLLMLNFITRVVGNHELMLLPLYSFLQKYISGHQRNVSAVLAYAVQACHNYIPPEEIIGILKSISFHFVTERCSEEQMSVGINAITAICTRVPSVMCVQHDDDSGGDETHKSTSSTTTLDMEAFARDLAGFAKHRDRSVRCAGQTWLNFVREVHPGLLSGKDRGLKGSALHKNGRTQPLRYGETKIATGVEGADLLYEYEAKKKKAAAKVATGGKQESNQEEDADDDDEEKNGPGEWKDVADSSDDDEKEAPTLVRLDDEAKPPAQEDEDEQATVLDVSEMSVEEREKLKQQVSSTRIFTASEFERMRKLVEREQRAKRDPREAARRKRAAARGDDFEALSDDSSDESEDEQVRIKGAVNPEDIMATATRKRLSKAEKLEKIIAGRSQFEQKQRDGSSTNTEKNRKKNFLMTKFSKNARRKGRGKGGLQQKKNKRDKAAAGTHEARKRRRKL